MTQENNHEAKRAFFRALELSKRQSDESLSQSLERLDKELLHLGEELLFDTLLSQMSDFEALKHLTVNGENKRNRRLK